MHHFSYVNGRLFAEGCDLEAIAREVGTPFYCYSSATLERHARVLKDALYPQVDLIAYAVKANANISVLKTLAQQGLGADVVSGGEILRALQAGIPPEKIVFSGVGKTRDELTLAIEKGIFQINVESASELDDVASVARSLGRSVDVVFRVNPDIGAGGHAKITTGSRDNKFGIATEDAVQLTRTYASHDLVRVRGFAVHIGSQITDLSPLKSAYHVLKDVCLTLRSEGIEISRLDLGGGLGVPYELDLPAPPDPRAFGDLIRSVFSDVPDLHLSVEPGRVIVANAGILVTRVLHLNPRERKTFAIVDAAMNDLMRPALYDAHHDIWPVVDRGDDVWMNYDVAGPICETGDLFRRDARLKTLQKGDLIAFMTAGAYGAVMASTYNMRPRVAEVIVSGDQWCLTHARQSIDALLGQDVSAPWLG